MVIAGGNRAEPASQPTDFSGVDYDGAMSRARVLMTTLRERSAARGGARAPARQRELLHPSISKQSHEAVLGRSRNTGLRFFARQIREFAHPGFFWRAGRACYYLLETHMDARREPDYYAILQVDRRAHPLVITRVYRLLTALYSLARPCEPLPAGITPNSRERPH
jgi:hypothetical protein